LLKLFKIKLVIFFETLCISTQSLQRSEGFFRFHSGRFSDITFGALVVTLAMLLHLINCHFISIIIITAEFFTAQYDPTD